MSYHSVDATIQTWAGRHSLTVFTSFADRESRLAYTSSKARECFRIWIELPVAGQISVRPATTVTDWIVPSERFLLKRENP